MPGIHHLDLVVSDLERSLAFYRVQPLGYVARVRSRRARRRRRAARGPRARHARGDDQRPARPGGAVGGSLTDAPGVPADTRRAAAREGREGLRRLDGELARHARRLDRRADEQAGGDRADRGEAGADPQRVVQAVDVGAWRVGSNAAPAGTSAPRAATPTAMPAWRNVSFMPAARPLCSIGAEPSATAVTAGLNRPVPTPATSMPGSDRGPRGVGAGERHQRHADRDEREAAARSSRAARPSRPACASRPETKKITTVRGQVGEAGLDRRQPEHLLQVQRRVEEDREERGRDRRPPRSARR